MPANQLRMLHLCSARQYVGEAARVVDIAEHFREQGHHAEIIVRDKFSVAEQCSRRGIPYTSVRFNSKFNPITDLQDIITIRQRIKEFKPDIIHVHRGKEHWLTVAAMIGFRKKIPLVRSRHVVTKIKSHFANKWLFGSITDGIICVSKAVFDEVKKNDFIKCPIKIIHGGINQQRFLMPSTESIEKYRLRMKLYSNNKIISCLARIAPVKGQEYIIRAIPKIIEKIPNAVFLFAYPRQSDYRKKIDEIIDELKIRNHVNFIGSIDVLGLFFKISDLGILASIDSEGWSRATVEFMYHGVPMVATDVGCLSEIIENDLNGLVVPPKDSSSLAEAVVKLLSDEEKLEEMGKNARDLVIKKWTLEITAKNIFEFYNELILRKNSVRK